MNALDVYEWIIYMSDMNLLPFIHEDMKYGSLTDRIESTIFDPVAAFIGIIVSLWNFTVKYDFVLINIDMTRRLQISCVTIVK